MEYRDRSHHYQRELEHRRYKLDHEFSYKCGTTRNSSASVNNAATSWAAHEIRMRELEAPSREP